MNLKEAFNFDTCKLNSELKMSYEKYIKNYPNSLYYPIIKGYYDILKKNRFIQNDESSNYLEKNNIFDIFN